MSTAAPPRPHSGPPSSRPDAPRPRAPRPRRARPKGHGGQSARRRAVRRTSDVVRGLFAAALLTVLLVGPPLLLWQMAPMLLPTAVPRITDLTAALMAPDDGTLFLRALAVVGVLAWSSFAAAVTLEALALIRGWRLPPLPLLGIQQRTASGLVASVAVLFVAPAAVAAPPVIAAAVTQPAAPATAPASTSTGAGAGEPVVVQVTVHRGDTLWGIAEHHLGHGDLYPEIVEATREVVQPGGQHLRDADHIYPGWVVMVPQAGSATAVPPPSQLPAAEASSGASAPPSASAADTDEKPTPQAQAPAASASPTSPAPASPATSMSRASEPSPSTTPLSGLAQGDADDRAEEEDAPADLWMLGAGAVLSGLTAAGLAGLLKRRRRRQQRHRRAGRHLPIAPPPAQTAQRQVHSAQDPFTVDQLDRVLRALAARCAAETADLPDVQSVRLTDERIELHLGTPSRPVSPFTAAGAEEVLWYLQRDAPLDEPLRDADGPTPFPALTVIGRDLDGALVLVDLESVTELSVSCDAGPSAGAADAVEAVLSAVVVDLATSPWAAEADVVVLGPARGLVQVLDVEHVHLAEDADALLDELEVWAAAVQRAVPHSAGTRPGAQRVTGDHGDALRPRVLVIDVPLRAEQTSRLERLVSVSSSGEQQVPLALVSTSAITPNAWALSLDTGAELAVLRPAGIRLSPQRLSAEARHLLASAAQVANAPTVEGTAVPVPRSEDSISVAANRAREDELPDAVPPTTAVRADVVHVHKEPVPSPQEATADGDCAQDANDRASEPLAEASAMTPPTATPATPAMTPPRIAVLGPVEVQGPAPSSAPSNNLSTMTELVALLAMYPNSQPHLVDSLLWPGERVPRNRRNQLISRTRTWLGADTDGGRYLPMATTEGYRLAPAVRSDWDDFRDLVGDDPAATPTEQLLAALSLVRGQPFAGVHPHRYAWADVPKQSMIELIVDVAIEVAERALTAGDATSARRATAVGLQAEPGSELLWRAALRAEHLAGNREALETLARRFTALAEELGDDLEPETHELITRLLPRTARDSSAGSGGSGHAS